MTTDAETRRLSRVGMVGLLFAVIIALMAPAIAGLQGSPHNYEGVRLEPGASVPLAADREMVLDSGDGAISMGDCLISGPGKWFRQIVGAGARSSFSTGPSGAYKINCQGGAVEVENQAEGHRAAGLESDLGRRSAITMFWVAAAVGLASVAVLIASGRAANQRDEIASDRADAEVDSHADEPESL